MFFIGAHITREKTLMETIKKIIEAEGNSLQIFASNPRSVRIGNFNEKFFGNPDDIRKFIQETNFKLVVHSPYVINLASPLVSNKRLLDLDECYWIKLILYELEIAHRIGAIGCIVHTGKHTKQTVKEGLLNMKIAITFILNEIKKNNWNSKLIIETSSGQGTELLDNYQDFLNFFNDFTEEQKQSFKICIDTCHIWASGYELKEVLDMTIKNGNIKDVAVVHLNNSKNPKGSNLDRHEIINKGHIDISDIYEFLKIKKMNKEIITILEMPSSNYQYEFNQLIKNT